MLAALSPDMLATDLAYYLARKGVSRYILECSRYIFGPLISTLTLKISSRSHVLSSHMHVISGFFRFVQPSLGGQLFLTT